MTHLKIEQNNGLIEEVSSAVIDKLYDIVHSGNLDNTSNLIGRLHTSATYLDYIDYLEDTFKVGDVKLLIIDATKKYIYFADPEVLSYWANSIYGDGVGIDTTAASGVLAIPNNAFSNNANIQTFNELGGYFPNCTTINSYAFNNTSNLTSIDLSNVTSIGACGFEGCTSLTTVGDLSNCTSIGYSVFNGCSDLGLNLTIELNLTNLVQYPSSAFRSTCFKRLILHWPNLSQSGDIGLLPVFSYMSNVEYIDLSDTGSVSDSRNSGKINTAVIYNCPSLITFIPSLTCNYLYAMEVFGNNMLYYKYLILLNTTPPTIDLAYFNLAFVNSRSDFRIYVPDSALQAYLTDSNWLLLGDGTLNFDLSTRVLPLSLLPAGVWTTGLASQYLTPALLATS